MRPRLIRVLMLAWLPGTLGCEPLVTSVGAWSASGGGAGTGSGGRAGASSAGGVAGAAQAFDGYLEAEDGELSGGFVAASDAAASNGAYLLAPAGLRSEDAPGPERARYRFVAREAGTFVIWGRIRALDAVHNRFWFRVDAGDWFKWRLSTGDIWFWDDLHDDAQYGSPLSFELDAGEHSLELANCADEVGLDRLYVSSQGDAPLGNTTPCKPPHSIEVAGRCLPSCGSLGGTACSDALCANLPQIDAYDCAICCRVN